MTSLMFTVSLRGSVKLDIKAANILVTEKGLVKLGFLHTFFRVCLYGVCGVFVGVGRCLCLCECFYVNRFVCLSLRTCVHVSVCRCLCMCVEFVTVWVCLCMNVMALQSGLPVTWTADFGVSLQLEHTVTRGGQKSKMVGTPLYMSPEALSGERVDYRVLLSSLRVITSA